MSTAEHIARGKRGEAAAARLLEQQGYRIIARNYRCRAGEIDIVAEDGEVLCFIEVRSRRSSHFGHPLETVDHRKQARIATVARHFMVTRNQLERRVRFDVVGLVYEPTPELTLVRGAFEPRSSW